VGDGERLFTTADDSGGRRRTADDGRPLCTIVDGDEAETMLVTLSHFISSLI